MILGIILTPHVYDGVRKIKVETVGLFTWFKGPYEIPATNELFSEFDIDELYSRGIPMSFHIDKEKLLAYQDPQ
jgi:hypothetical protein